MEKQNGSLYLYDFITSPSMNRVARNIRIAIASRGEAFRTQQQQPFNPPTHKCQCGLTIYSTMSDYHQETDMHHNRMRKIFTLKKITLEQAYDELFALAQPNVPPSEHFETFDIGIFLHCSSAELNDC